MKKINWQKYIAFTFGVLVGSLVSFFLRFLITDTVMPDWAKSTSMFLAGMITWDIARMFAQAKLNQWMLRKNFHKIEKDLDDLEKDLENSE